MEHWGREGRKNHKGNQSMTFRMFIQYWLQVPHGSDCKGLYGSRQSHRSQGDWDPQKRQIHLRLAEVLSSSFHCYDFSYLHCSHQEPERVSKSLIFTEQEVGRCNKGPSSCLKQGFCRSICSLLLRETTGE